MSLLGSLLQGDWEERKRNTGKGMKQGKETEKKGREGGEEREGEGGRDVGDMSVILCHYLQGLVCSHFTECCTLSS